MELSRDPLIMQLSQVLGTLQARPVTDEGNREILAIEERIEERKAELRPQILAAGTEKEQLDEVEHLGRLLQTYRALQSQPVSDKQQRELGELKDLIDQSLNEFRPKYMPRGRRVPEKTRQADASSGESRHAPFSGTIRPGDILKIEIQGGLPVPVPPRTVEPDGSIALGGAYSYDRLDVGGKTLTEAGKLIETELRPIVKDPHVLVIYAGHDNGIVAAGQKATPRSHAPLSGPPPRQRHASPARSAPATFSILKSTVACPWRRSQSERSSLTATWQSASLTAMPAASMSPA